VELDEAIEEAKTQQVQNECLDKALEIKGEEEEKEVEQMIQTESELRETKELDKKKKELLKGLDKESKRIIESQDDLTEAVRKMREEMKQKMVQVVTGLNRYTDSEMCYFMEFNFPDTVRSTS
jgi:high-affinity Fe2+/Pb2+ permease